MLASTVTVGDEDCASILNRVFAEGAASVTISGDVSVQYKGAATDRGVQRFPGTLALGSVSSRRFIRCALASKLPEVWSSRAAVR